MEDAEKEARNRLIDAARTDVVFLAEQQTDIAESLDRLGQQAHGDADRLHAAAEQLRHRFSGAEAIPLLEAAASHVERSTDLDPPVGPDQSPSAPTAEEGPPRSVW